MSSLAGLNGAMYVDNTQYTSSTTLGLSIERAVAEVQIQQQSFVSKAVGPYSGEFSGTGVVDSTEQTLLGYVTVGTSATVAIYPTNDTSDYWYFTGYFVSWAVEGPSDGFWTIDFGGIISGALSEHGFS